MTSQMGGIFQQTWQRLGDLGRPVVSRLQTLGILPRFPQVPEDFQEAVQAALRPVEPSPDFRASLRQNLSLAASHKATGLVVEHPQSHREGIILGASLGLLAVTIAALVLVLRPHPTKAVD
jgi:hypothetical protein